MGTHPPFRFLYKGFVALHLFFFYPFNDVYHNIRCRMRRQLYPSFSYVTHCFISAWKMS